jgi:hypothetical protein
VKEGDIHIQWMAGAQTNISYNALGKVKKGYVKIFTGAAE